MAGSVDLVIAAPPRLHRVLRQAFAAIGARARCIRRDRAKRGPDPFSLAALAAQWRSRCRGVLLIAPRAVSPSRCCPAPVLNGLPVGCVFADRENHLRPWLNAMRMRARDRGGNTADGNAWAVLSPWNGYHLPAARVLQRRLRRAGRKVSGWFADRTTGAQLCARLGNGPHLAVYLGHGTPAGLDAYGGVDARALAVGRQRAVGTMVVFACRTAARRRHGSGFAERLVESGSAISCLGAVGDVGRAPNACLAHLWAGCVGRGVRSLGEGMAMVASALHGSALHDNDELRRVFSRYRLLGSPIQPF